MRIDTRWSTNTCSRREVKLTSHTREVQDRSHAHTRKEPASFSYLGSTGADACGDERISGRVMQLDAESGGWGGEPGGKGVRVLGVWQKVPWGRIASDWKGGQQGHMHEGCSRKW